MVLLIRLIGNYNGSNIVYKPTVAANIGWYRCNATPIDGQTVQSEDGYPNVIGASILSYNVTLVLVSKQGLSDDINTDGLTEELEKAIKQSTSNDMLRKGSIDNIIIMEEDSKTCQTTVSFNVCVQYDYSLTQSIADQAIEASQHHS